MKISYTKNQNGQALITLLLYVMILAVVTTAAVLLFVLNIQSGVKLQESIRAYYVAESGAENALLRILRDPTYTGESNLPVGDGLATIVVTPGSQTIVNVTGTVGSFTRKVQVVVNYSGGSYTISSWQEVQ